MKIKDTVYLIFASLLLGALLVNAHPSNKEPLLETPPPDQDTLLNVQGKTALFIGDSHTANHQFGWQKQLSDSVGFKMINASVSGKTTYWMLEQALYRVNDNIDYCFIYGGANDMYSRSISPKTAVDNIKGMARICRGHNVKCIILTGFDAKECTRTTNPNYAVKYTAFQHLLLKEDMEGAFVVDTRTVARTDCWDDLCHMRYSGHKKVTKKVIQACKFKTF